MAVDCFDRDDTFVACFVGEAGRACDIADRVDAGFGSPAERVGDDESTLDFDVGRVESEVLDVTGHPDGEDSGVELADRVADRGDEHVAVPFEAIDLRARSDVDAALLNESSSPAAISTSSTGRIWSTASTSVTLEPMAA